MSGEEKNTEATVNVSEVMKAEPTTKEPEKKQKLTPQQQRAQERAAEYNKRLQADMDRTWRALQDRFMDFFIRSDDPTGPEVEQKIKQLSSQWKIYASSKGLKLEFDAMKQYCEKIIEEYKQKME